MTEQTRQIDKLVSDGEDMNKSTKLLFKAVEDDDIKILELALGQPNVDVNMQNVKGETPLLLSIQNKNSLDFIMKLIGTGCDVNISNLEKTTALHLAILFPSCDIGHELIKRGANIDAQETPLQRHQNCTHKGCVWANKKTALHYAVLKNNLEAVCMLLYYGADVHVSDGSSKPINYAIYHGFEDIVKVLSDFHDESHYLQKVKQDKFFYGVFPFEYVGSDLLINCFDNALLFSFLWRKMNPCSFPPSELHSLLSAFLNKSHFSLSDWLQCLYLILEVFAALQRKNVLVLQEHKSDKSDFADLFDAFCNKNVEQADRVAIINVFLSLGAPATLDDCEYAHQLFGFAEEVEALIYAINYFVSANHVFTTSNFILAMEQDFSKESITVLLKLHFGKSRLYSRRSLVIAPADYFASLCEFFSLSADLKREILGFFMRHSEPAQKRIASKLECIPEFPTLFELARNQARKYLKEACEIKYPYQFHDCVKKLNFPEVIKDVIRFKSSIY